MSAPRKPGIVRLVIELETDTVELIRRAIEESGDRELTADAVAARLLKRRLTPEELLDATRPDRLH